MAIVFSNTKTRPVPVSISNSLKETIGATKAELIDFGTAGAYISITRGTLFGAIPFIGELYRNGPSTPRANAVEAEAWLRSMGLLEMKSDAIEHISEHGEAYTHRFFVTAE